MRGADQCTKSFDVCRTTRSAPVPLTCDAPRACYEKTPHYSMNPAVKPDAKMRLLALYGMGGFSMSMRDWHASMPKPPEWLEVRLLELPGHGFRDSEPLPFDDDEMEMNSLTWPPTELSHISAGRDALVRQLVDEAMPLLNPPPGSSAGQSQTALFGFSNGAMLVYLMALELQRRGLPPPCCVLVSGRGAPHHITAPIEALLHGSAVDTETMLASMRHAGVITQDHSFPNALAAERFVALCRSDQPLGTLEAGTRPDGAARGELASAPPRLACPLVALLSDGDTMWPAQNHLAPWADVALDPKVPRDPDLPRGFTAVTIDGVPHHELQAHKKTRAAVFSELAAITAKLCAAADRTR